MLKCFLFLIHTHWYSGCIGEQLEIAYLAEAYLVCRGNRNKNKKSYKVQTKQTTDQWLTRPKDSQRGFWLFGGWASHVLRSRGRGQCRQNSSGVQKLRWSNSGGLPGGKQCRKINSGNRPGERRMNKMKEPWEWAIEEMWLILLQRWLIGGWYWRRLLRKQSQWSTNWKRRWRPYGLGSAYKGSSASGQTGPTGSDGSDPTGLGGVDSTGLKTTEKRWSRKPGKRKQRKLRVWWWQVPRLQPTDHGCKEEQISCSSFMKELIYHSSDMKELVYRLPPSVLLTYFPNKKSLEK